MGFLIIYYFLKVLFRFSIGSFYSKIIVKGAKNLSKGKPVIIAMNHPNAFMDPISFADNVEMPMRYLARGDAFKKGLAPVLRAVGIIPIYRLSDVGREGVLKNDETFKEVSIQLKKRNHVIIFPEGLCVQERRLRNLKKGLAARMVLGAMADSHDEEIVIVPVGMNYQNHPGKFRHKLFMNIGEPIAVKDYFAAYQENNVKTVNRLTAVIQDAMKKTLVHIAHPDNDQLVEEIEEVFLEQSLIEKGIDRKNLEQRHELSVKIANAVNTASVDAPEKISSLKPEIHSYLQKVEKSGVRDKLISEQYKSYSSLASLLMRSLMFVIGIPIWICGLITNYIPYYISWKLGKKLTRRGKEWYAAVSMLIGSFLFPIYYIIETLVVWFIFHDLKIVGAFVALTFFSGWFSMHFSPFRKKLAGSWRMYSIRKNKTLYSSLVEERKKIVQEIRSLLSASGVPVSTTQTDSSSTQSQQ
jgi:glycerol-3-phosphate O-acyltransferase / dihydroxyacetone phosphate acyltransferase